jgi:hypothetical protein
MYRFSTQYVSSIYSFLSRIGIEVEERSIGGFTFLPGVMAEKGMLIVDPSRLRFPGDLLFEAGRLALSSPAQRMRLSGDLNQLQDNNGEAENETAIILWSYAALKAIGLPEDVVFYAEGYRGDANWMITNFKEGNFIGLSSLEEWGLTQASIFPAMEKWLREEPASQNQK